METQGLRPSQLNNRVAIEAGEQNPANQRTQQAYLDNFVKFNTLVVFGNDSYHNRESLPKKPFNFTSSQVQRLC